MKVVNTVKWYQTDWSKILYIKFIKSFQRSAVHKFIYNFSSIMCMWLYVMIWYHLHALMIFSSFYLAEKYISISIISFNKNIDITWN